MMALTQKKTHDTERCNHCGKSVGIGSGRFINRIPDFNDIPTRRLFNRKYIWGNFVCAECDDNSATDNE